MVRNSVYFLCLFLLFTASNDGFCQKKAATSVDPDASRTTDFSYLPSAKGESGKKEKRFQLFARSGSKSNKKNKGSLSWELDQQVVEYEKRMKAVVKQNRKEARLALNPKYSDPSYFGHKRKPKKRKPGKRKLCKECQIVH